MDLEGCSCIGEDNSLSNSVDVTVNEVMEEDVCFSNLQKSDTAKSQYWLVN